MSLTRVAMLPPGIVLALAFLSGSAMAQTITVSNVTPNAPNKVIQPGGYGTMTTVGYDVATTGYSVGQGLYVTITITNDVTGKSTVQNTSIILGAGGTATGSFAMFAPPGNTGNKATISVEVWDPNAPTITSTGVATPKPTYN